MAFGIENIRPLIMSGLQNYIPFKKEKTRILINYQLVVKYLSINQSWLNYSTYMKLLNQKKYNTQMRKKFVLEKPSINKNINQSKNLNFSVKNALKNIRLPYLLINTGKFVIKISSDKTGDFFFIKMVIFEYVIFYSASHQEQCSYFYLLLSWHKFQGSQLPQNLLTWRFY